MKMTILLIAAFMVLAGPSLAIERPTFTLQPADTYTYPDDTVTFVAEADGHGYPVDYTWYCDDGSTVWEYVDNGGFEQPPAAQGWPLNPVVGQGPVQIDGWTIDGNIHQIWMHNKTNYNIFFPDYKESIPQGNQCIVIQHNTSVGGTITASQMLSNLQHGKEYTLSFYSVLRPGQGHVGKKLKVMLGSKVLLPEFVMTVPAPFVWPHHEVSFTYDASWGSSLKFVSESMDSNWPSYFLDGVSLVPSEIPLPVLGKGPAVQFAAAPELDGNYYFCVAESAAGRTLSKRALLSVYDMTEPLVAVAKPDQTVPVGNTVTLSAQHSRIPQGQYVAYSWRQLSGPDIDLPPAESMKARPRFKADQIGQYVFELKLSTEEKTSTDTVRVHVVEVETVQNGQFASQLAGWNVTGSGSAMQVSHAPTGGINGSGAVRIDLNNATPGGVELSQSLQLEPFRTYLLKGWIRGDSVVQGQPPTGWAWSAPETIGPSLAVDFWLTDSIRGSSNSRLAGTFDWTPVTLDFVTGADGRRTIYLRAGTGGMTGTLWFDNVSVELDPMIKTVERPLFTRHYDKGTYDRLAPAQAEEYVDEMGYYWKAVTELTGHHPYEFGKVSMTVPRFWNIYAGAWSTNPILMSNAHTSWEPGKFRETILEVGTLHEMCHLVSTKGMGVWGEMDATIFFMYALQTHQFGGHVPLDSLAEAFYHVYEDEWLERGVVEGGMLVYFWFRLADEVGWDYFKRMYRMAVVTTMPDSPSARLWKVGLDYPAPTADYLLALQTGCRWMQYHALFDIIEQESGFDVWSVMESGQKAAARDNLCTCSPPCQENPFE